MSLLTGRLAPRIIEEDGAFRTRMLGIAAGMSDVIALGRGDSDFHTPAHIVEAAKAALDAGASIVNDIAANRESSEMWQTVAKAKAGYVCMHMLGTPQTMQAKPRYDEVVREVGDFFAERLAKLAEHEVSGEQVVLDPSIGFGKELEHNIKLLRGLNQFSVAERPLLVGVSRKSFIGKLLGTPLEERLPASLACAVWSVIKGAHIVRVHDVAETAQAVRMAETLNAQN